MIANGLIEGPKPTATSERPPSIRTGADANGDGFAKIMREARNTNAEPAKPAQTSVTAKPAPIAEASKPAKDVDTLKAAETDSKADLPVAALIQAEQPAVTDITAEGTIPQVKPVAEIPVAAVVDADQSGTADTAKPVAVPGEQITETPELNVAVSGDAVVDESLAATTTETLNTDGEIATNTTPKGNGAGQPILPEVTAETEQPSSSNHAQSVLADDSGAAPQSAPTVSGAPAAAAVSAQAETGQAGAHTPKAMAETNTLGAPRASGTSDTNVAPMPGTPKTDGEAVPTANANPKGVDNGHAAMPKATAETGQSSSSQNAQSVLADDSGAPTQSAPSVAGPLPGPPTTVAALAAEPAHGSVAPNSIPPMSQQPALPMNNTAWPETLVQTISQSVDSNIENLSITMTPERLGTLQIKLEMIDGVANVKIVTETPEAAKLFVDAQGRLGDLMNRAGLEMGSHSATSGGNSSASGQQNDGEGSGQYGQEAADGPAMTELEPETVLSGLPRYPHLSATVDLLA